MALEMGDQYASNPRNDEVTTSSEYRWDQICHGSIHFSKGCNCATFSVPACESWLLGRVKKRSPGVSKVKYVPDKEGILALDKYEVGDFFSTDKFVIPTSGRLPTVYGSKHHHNLFHSGTIYYDAASGLIWVENQVSLGINETV